MEQDKAIWARATWGECELGNAQRPKRAVALAEGLSHPFSLAYALGCAASFHSLRREGQLAREQLEALITLSTEQGFPYWLAVGTIERGWVLAAQGQEEEGIAQMQQGLAALRTLGTETARLVHLPRLAAAYARAGRVEGRAERGGRSAGFSGQNWDAYGRGRAVYAEGVVTTSSLWRKPS